MKFLETHGDNKKEEDIEEENKSLDSLNTDYTLKQNTTRNIQSNREFFKEKLHYIKGVFCQNLKSFFLLNLATILYLISLQGDFRFMTDLDTIVLISSLLLSCSLFAILYFLTFINKCQRYFAFLESIILFYLFYCYDIKKDNGYHGGYNRVFLIYGIIFFSIFLLMIHFLTQLIINSKKSILFIVFSMITFLIVYLNYNKSSSCSYWSKGLRNTEIDFKDGICLINQPKICSFIILDNIFDFSSFFQETCESIGNNNYELLNKYILVKNAKIIGYPNTNKYDFFEKSAFGNLKRNVLNEVVNMEDTNNTDIETIVNFYHSPPKVTIQLKRNEILVQERKVIYDQNKEKVLSKNVLIIYIDSLSRAHFKRKLEKTYAWIENKYKNENSDLKSFQFLKYHNLQDYTKPNMIAGFFGTSYKERKGVEFIKQYIDKGYITGNAMDYCARDVIEDFEAEEAKNLQFYPFDHEFGSLFCDPNYGSFEAPYSAFNGPSSLRKKCLYSQPTQDYVFDYINQFWEAYKNEPKVFRFGSLQSHEGSGEMIKYLDDSLYNFLIDFERKKYLDDTILFFISDHGFTRQGPYYFLNTQDFKIEISLPSLFIVMNKHMASFQIYSKFLKSNEQSMVTPFDIYSSLNSIVDLNFSHHASGESLLLNTVDKNKRNCKFFDIDEKYCQCKDRI